MGEPLSGTACWGSPVGGSGHWWAQYDTTLVQMASAVLPLADATATFRGRTCRPIGFHIANPTRLAVLAELVDEDETE